MSSVTNPVLAARESSYFVSSMSNRSKEPERRRSHKEAPAPAPVPEREVTAEKEEAGQRPDEGGGVSAKGEDKEDGDYIPRGGAAATAEAGEGAAEQGQEQGQDEEASS